MLCPNVCECGTVGHDVCETMGAGVTMYADFVDRVINSPSVSCQRNVMPVTKSAEVYSVRTL